MLKRTGWIKGWVKAVWGQPSAKLGLGLVSLFVLVIVVHPLLLGWVWPTSVYDPRAGYDIEVTHPAPNSWRHPLGTDGFGKDALSMLMAGTAPSVIAAGTAAISATIVALILASLVVSFRRTGRVLNVLIDGALYIPIPAVMLILGADPWADRLTPALFGLVFGGLTGASSGALVLRSQALPLMKAGFIDAARVAGATRGQVIRRHLIPAMLPLAGVYGVLAAGGAIITQGFLSWLAYTASKSDWGTLIYWALTTQLFTGGLQWNIIISAGIAISLCTLGFFLLATGLRRAASEPPRH